MIRQIILSSSILVSPLLSLAQTENVKCDNLIQAMESDSSEDYAVRMRWLLFDGSILQVDKLQDTAQNRAISVRWIPNFSHAEKEP
jgi:hypothetical protein